MTGPIYNTQLNTAEHGGRGSGLGNHKRLIDSKKETFNVKVINLNNMVQIRKRKPKMKYNDKLQYRCN